jgi:hypothetical protein
MDLNVNTSQHSIKAGKIAAAVFGPQFWESNGVELQLSGLRLEYVYVAFNKTARPEVRAYLTEALRGAGFVWGQRACVWIGLTVNLPEGVAVAAGVRS